MRKLLIPILMASALAPVAAFAQESDPAADRRAERAAWREQRDEKRPEQPRPEKVERRSPEMRVTRPASDEGAERRSDVARDRAFGERGREMRTDRAFGERGRDMRSDRATDVARDGDRVRWEHRGQVTDQGSVDRRGRPALPPVTQPVLEGNRRVVPETRDGHRTGGFDELRGRVIRDGQRVGDRHDDRHRDWRRDWRYDHRYDWRRHRDRNRWVFRIGTYYDPYRYGYRRFSIGYNLWPSYYGSNYWLNDPWQYRLPPAYGPYRWIRYYDDALLVNIYTGQVVDVIYSFFW